MTVARKQERDEEQSGEVLVQWLTFQVGTLQVTRTAVTIVTSAQFA